MKAVAVTATVLTALAFVATVTLGVLGIWVGDGRLGSTAAIGVVVTIIIALIAAFSWIAESE